MLQPPSFLFPNYLHFSLLSSGIITSTVHFYLPVYPTFKPFLWIVAAAYAAPAYAAAYAALASAAPASLLFKLLLRARHCRRHWGYSIE